MQREPLSCTVLLRCKVAQIGNRSPAIPTSHSAGKKSGISLRTTETPSLRRFTGHALRTGLLSTSQRANPSVERSKLQLPHFEEIPREEETRFPRSRAHTPVATKEPISLAQESPDSFAARFHQPFHWHRNGIRIAVIFFVGVNLLDQGRIVSRRDRRDPSDLVRSKFFCSPQPKSITSREQHSSALVRCSEIP